MKSIIINVGYGPFCISHKAFLRLRDLGQPDALNEVNQGEYWPKAAAQNEPSLNQCGKLIPRDDAKLVQTIKELGNEANGHATQLKIVEIPEDVLWAVEKLDGIEHVSEQHRTWGMKP
ncbi:MAG: hypothetical protein ABW047_07815 [Nitrospiraceae bacterium]